MSYGREDTTIEPDFIEPDAPLAASGGVADNIGGTMQNSGSRGTLDETVLQTLKRDVVEINSRLKTSGIPAFPLII
ncbi:BEM_HP_G0079290.mRNA.1.CDS.1 [Saccharomyces cerevisiae]|nr:BEM_HP_G0079290.mRNA.1.CDS.1 [Saccharomyces cerevisiae]CAI6991199.1 BEM_HP_G0079290.mRNA.1.CDS.1 [Saccharomyces cerevisiae]